MQGHLRPHGQGCLCCIFAPMKKLLLLCLALPMSLLAQDDTDIYLFDNVKYINNGVRLMNAVQVTPHKGYDNQPTFSADGAYLYYSAMRDGKQTDVYRYHIASNTEEQLTDTPESEYSPTPAPDGKSLSVVKVEKNKTQRLWRIPLTGKRKKQTPIAPAVDSVGYHCWLDEQQLAVYVLGKTPTLRLIDLRNSSEKIVARNIGRCFTPTDGGIYLTQEIKGAWWLTLYKLNGDQQHTVDTLMAMPQNAEDFALLPNGMAVVGSQGTFFGCFPGAETQWLPLCSLPETHLQLPSRLAVGPFGKKYAVVFKEIEARD